MPSKNGSFSTKSGLWVLILGLLGNGFCPQTGRTVALAVKDTIDLRGNQLRTDSFDSGDLNYSNNGFYPAGDLNRIKDNGDVWAQWGLTNSLKAGGADIMGNLKTGAGMPTTWFGCNGAVGDKDWVANAKVGIQPGHASNDFYTVFSDVALPPASWLPAFPSYRTIDGTNYKYTFFVSGNYSINNLSGSVYVGTNANIQLRLAGSVSLSGQSIIRISPQNATVRLFLDVSSCSLSNNACIDNQSGRAERCCLLGTPNCTNINFAGNGAFCGVVYAPQADFTLSSGNSNAGNFIGCSITKSLTLYSDWSFHYDENWERVGRLPPWITSQPQSQTVPVGSSPELSAGTQWTSNDIRGTWPSFQWRFNETNIPGATNANLVLTNIAASQAGMYSVLVNNELGSLSSSNVPVSVYHPAAARFGSPQVLSGNRFQFSVSIQPGWRYAIETSTNLVDWVPVTTNTGSCLFEAPETLQFPRRYYRSVYLP